jgi:uncharacterized damage-inducible protein DinB
MSDLQSLLPTILAERYAAHSRRIHELAASLDDDQFWKKPFPFGNSFGHLVLHLTGNLSYYIGAQIAKTGYVRDRPREFADANPPSKAEALRRFDDAVAIAVQTVRKQSAEDWVADYSAVGSLNAPNRLAIFLVCDSHLQHHIGQMIYLVEQSKLLRIA